MLQLQGEGKQFNGEEDFLSHVSSKTHGSLGLQRFQEKVERLRLRLRQKSEWELTPATLTPLKSRNLEPNLESDSDSFWEKSRLQATPTPGIVATLGRRYLRGLELYGVHVPAAHGPVSLRRVPAGEVLFLT